ncbi:heparanase-like [Amphiura filiformis]|uniref:heparanase-like n=1 Tax=Amphiura filiformis TaxID=82378 RepID=UPI003B20EF00
MACEVYRWVTVLCALTYIFGTLTVSVDSCLYRWWTEEEEVAVQNSLPKIRITATSYIPVLVFVNTTQRLHTVDDRFLSVAIDSNIIRAKWKGFDFNSPKLKTLAKALVPTILRLGGNDADFLIFNATLQRRLPNQTKPSPSMIQTNRTTMKSKRDKARVKKMKAKWETNFTMTAEDWDNINKFAIDVGWQIVFDFNMLLRNDTSWDSSNAELLLKYTRERGYNITGWELGNEPDQIYLHSNITISAEQLAHDVIGLRQLLDTHGFQESFLIGPDVTNPSPGSVPAEFLQRYLRSCGNSTFATTWHSYSVNGKHTSVDKFINADIMDSLKKEIEEVAKYIQASRPYLPKSWIGETAGAYNSGAPGLSNTFVGGFLWLDKLGLSAANGVDLVIRQTFFGGYYGLLDKNSNPTPVFWLSVLYKQLVGPIVLNVSSTSPDLRAYAHCTNNQTRYYNTGHVTLFVINLQQESHILLTLTGDLAGKKIFQYLLTPNDKKNITATEVDLNGKLLQLTEKDTLPIMKGKELSPHEPITLPPLCYAFFVIDANVTACYQ